MKETISNELGVHLSLETIRKGIISLGITLKRNGLILDRVNDPTRILLRKEYATNFLTSAPIDDMKNVFIDESGFNLHMRRNYGRSLAGARSSSTVPTIRGRNVTLLSTMNAGGVIHYKIFVGSCTSAIFSEFVLQVDEIMQNELNVYDGFIYMDNAKAHTAANSRNAMNTMVNGFIFLSPYSYMLNPIEFSYSKIKACVRNLLHNTEGMELPQLIAMGIASVSETDASGWYRLIRRNCALAMQEFVFK
jgi:transposase